MRIYCVVEGDELVGYGDYLEVGVKGCFVYIVEDGVDVVFVGDFFDFGDYVVVRFDILVCIV